MPPKKPGPFSVSALEGHIIGSGKSSLKLGKRIGLGGFGAIYLGTPLDGKLKAHGEMVVAKVEPETSGGLYSEMNCYKNLDMVAWGKAVSVWKSSHKIAHLGVPNMIECFTTSIGDIEGRVMVLDRLGASLQSYLDSHTLLPGPLAMQYGGQLLDALEYTHSFGYAHADIKAANVCFSPSSKTLPTPLIYLIDYGIACKFLGVVGDESTHVEYKPLPKKAHDGTLEFTSTDAHRGAAPSRRGDLEILAFNLLQWTGAFLPWHARCAGSTPKTREAIGADTLKQKSVFFPYGKITSAVKSSISAAINSLYQSSNDELAELMTDYVCYVNSLDYYSIPDYAKLHTILSGLQKSTSSKGGKKAKMNPVLEEPPVVISLEDDEEEERAEKASRSTTPRASRKKTAAPVHHLLLEDTVEDASSSKKVISSSSSSKKVNSSSKEPSKQTEKPASSSKTDFEDESSKLAKRLINAKLHKLKN